MYDAWNRLVSVKNTGGTTIAGYTYDALGDRITETYGTGTTNHLYYAAGGGVIEERQGSTAASATSYQYVWGASGNLVLRDTVSSGSVVAASRLYALQDANGDTTALVNTSGTVVERFEYSPYGVVTVLNEAGTAVADANGWRYLFQGGRLDTATGLYLFGARDYSPAQGIWIERDPIGLGGGDLNETRFVGNQPTDQIDPSGLDGGLSAGIALSYRRSIFLLQWFEHCKCADRDFRRSSRQNIQRFERFHFCRSRDGSWIRFLF